MYWIAHRGNWSGRNAAFENNPVYVMDAVSRGYDVEIDLWVVSGILYLGHDEAQFPITDSYLENIQDVAWIHAKNLEAVEWLSNTGLNWFWHEEDRMTITSKRMIWCFPETFIKGSIVNQPSYGSKFWTKKMWSKIGIIGICHDNLIECQSRMLEK